MLVLMLMPLVMKLQLPLLLYCTVIVPVICESHVPLVPVLFTFPVFESALEKCDRDRHGLNTSH